LRGCCDLSSDLSNVFGEFLDLSDRREHYQAVVLIAQQRLSSGDALIEILLILDDTTLQVLQVSFHSHQSSIDLSDDLAGFPNGADGSEDFASTVESLGFVVHLGHLLSHGFSALQELIGEGSAELSI
jgi:hypothetical protein